MVGQTASASVTVSNGSTNPVQISQVQETGQYFSVTGQNNLPVAIAAASTYNVNVQFDPGGAGAATGTLTVMSNAAGGGTATIALSGNGESASPSAALSSLSCSSGTLTGASTDACTVTLTGAAGTGGLAVSLSSSDSAVTVPGSVTVPAGASSAGFTATGSAVTTSQTATLTAAAGGVSKSYALQLSPSSPSAALSSLSCSSGTLTGASTDACTVTLTGAAGTGGLAVSLSSSDSAVTVPGSVTVPAGASSAGFTATGSAVTTSQTATLTAAAGGVTRSYALQLSPSSPSAALSGLSCSSGTLTGAGTDACTVTLTGAAGTGGLAVSLSSSDSAVTVPGSVTVPAGASSAGFTATAAAVTTTQTATLTAAAGGVSKSYALQLSPSAPSAALSSLSCSSGTMTGAGTDACTVTLTGAASTGGLAVSLSSSDSAVTVPGSVDGAGRSVERGLHGHRLGGNDFADGDADGGGGRSDQELRAAADGGRTGTERIELRQRHDDGSGDRCLHGDADGSGGHGRPGGEPVEQRQCGDGTGQCDGAGRSVERGLHGHRLGGNDFADGDADGGGGRSDQELCAAADGGRTGTERIKLRQRHDDGSGDRCLHGDADGSGGHGRPGGEPVEQRQCGDGAGQCDGAGRCVERGLHGHRLGGNDFADGDADGGGGRSEQELRAAAEPVFAIGCVEQFELQQRHADGCEYRCLHGDADGSGGHGRPGGEPVEQRQCGDGAGQCDGAGRSVERGLHGDRSGGDDFADGDADGGGGRSDQELCAAADGGRTGTERIKLRQRHDDGSGDRCLHGDADGSGGHGRPGGEPVEQRQCGDGAGQCDGAGRSVERGLHGDRSGGDDFADGDADGGGGRSEQELRAAAEPVFAIGCVERIELQQRHADGCEYRCLHGDADGSGGHGRPGGKPVEQRQCGDGAGQCDGAGRCVERGLHGDRSGGDDDADGDADGGGGRSGQELCAAAEPVFAIGRTERIELRQRHDDGSGDRCLHGDADGSGGHGRPGGEPVEQRQCGDGAGQCDGAGRCVERGLHGDRSGGDDDADGDADGGGGWSEQELRAAVEPVCTIGCVEQFELRQRHDDGSGDRCLHGDADGSGGHGRPGGEPVEQRQCGDGTGQCDGAGRSVERGLHGDRSGGDDDADGDADGGGGWSEQELRAAVEPVFAIGCVERIELQQRHADGCEYRCLHGDADGSGGHGRPGGKPVEQRQCGDGAGQCDGAGRCVECGLHGHRLGGNDFADGDADGGGGRSDQELRAAADGGRTGTERIELRQRHDDGSGDRCLHGDADGSGGHGRPGGEPVEQRQCGDGAGQCDGAGRSVERGLHGHRLGGNDFADGDADGGGGRSDQELRAAAEPVFAIGCVEQFELQQRHADGCEYRCLHGDADGSGEHGRPGGEPVEQRQCGDGAGQCDGAGRSVERGLHGDRSGGDDFADGDADGGGGRSEQELRAAAEPVFAIGCVEQFELRQRHDDGSGDRCLHGDADGSGGHGRPGGEPVEQRQCGDGTGQCDGAGRSVERGLHGDRSGGDDDADGDADGGGGWSEQELRAAVEPVFAIGCVERIELQQRHADGWEYRCLHGDADGSGGHGRPGGKPVEQRQCGDGAGQCDGAGRCVECGLHGHRLGGNDFADGDADGGGGRSDQELRAAADGGRTGTERIELRQRHDDGSGDRCLHGDADGSGGHGRPGGEPVEQRQCGDGAGQCDGAGRSVERGLHGHRLGGNDFADGDADGGGGRSDQELRAAAEPVFAIGRVEQFELQQRHADGCEYRCLHGDADGSGEHGRPGGEPVEQRQCGDGAGQCDGAGRSVERGLHGDRSGGDDFADGDADGGGGRSEQELRAAAEPVFAIGCVEQFELQQRHADGCEYRCLHGDADGSGGHGRPGGEPVEQRQCGDGAGQCDGAGRCVERGLHGHRLGGNDFADGDADGVGGWSDQELRAAAEPVFAIGRTERIKLRQRHADGSGYRCLHGDADGSGEHGRPGGEPVEQRQCGDGTGQCDGAGRSVERGLHGHRLGGNDFADGDADGGGGRSDQELRAAVEPVFAIGRTERIKLQQRHADGCEYRCLHGDADGSGGHGRPGGKPVEQRQCGDGAGQCDGAGRCVERGLHGDRSGGDDDADGDADGGGGWSEQELRAAVEPVCTIGCVEQFELQQRHDDGSGDRCLHGDADGSGEHGRPGGEPVEQRQCGDGTGQCDGAGRSVERGLHGHRLGGNDFADGDADGVGGRSDQELRAAVEPVFACADTSIHKCVVRRCDAEHAGDADGDADVIGDSSADDQRGNGDGDRVQYFGSKLPGDAEPGPDGDALHRVRSDGDGVGYRDGNADRQRVPRYRHDCVERDRTGGVV